MDHLLKANRSYKAFKHDTLIGPIFEVEEAFEGDGLPHRDAYSQRTRHHRRESQSSVLAVGSKQFYLPHHKKKSGGPDDAAYWSNPQLSALPAEESLTLPLQHQPRKDTASQHQSAIRDFGQLCAKDFALVASSSKHRRNPSFSRDELRLKPSHSQPTLSFAQPANSRHRLQDPSLGAPVEPIAVFSTSPEKRTAKAPKRTIRFEEFKSDANSMYQKKLPVKVIELPEEDEISKAVVEDSGLCASRDALLQLPVLEGARLSTSVRIPSDGGPSNGNQSALEVATPKFSKGRDINVSFGARKGSELQVSLVQLDRGDGCGQDPVASEASCLNINIQTPSAIKNLNINNFPSMQTRTSRKNTPRLSKEL